MKIGIALTSEQYKKICDEVGLPADASDVDLWLIIFSQWTRNSIGSTYCVTWFLDQSGLIAFDHFVVFSLLLYGNERETKIFWMLDFFRFEGHFHRKNDQSLSKWFVHFHPRLMTSFWENSITTKFLRLLSFRTSRKGNPNLSCIELFPPSCEQRPTGYSFPRTSVRWKKRVLEIRSTLHKDELSILIRRYC